MSWDHKAIPLNKRNCINSHLFHLSFVQEAKFSRKLSTLDDFILSHPLVPCAPSTLSNPRGPCHEVQLLTQGLTVFSGSSASPTVFAHFLSLLLSFLVPFTHRSPFPRLVQTPSAVPSRPLLGLLSPEQSDPSLGPHFSPRNSLRSPQLPLQVLRMTYKSVNLL